MVADKLEKLGIAPFSSYPCARFLKDQSSFPRVSAIDMVGNSFCFRPGGVVLLSSEPRAVNERVKSCKLIGKMWLGTNLMSLGAHD